MKTVDGAAQAAKDALMASRAHRAAEDSAARIWGLESSQAIAERREAVRLHAQAEHFARMAGERFAARLLA